MALVPPSTLYGWRIAVTGIFITALIGGLVIAGKPLLLLGVAVPGGVLLFPLSYSAVMVVIEVYGPETAERLIEVGLFCLLLFAVLLELSVNGVPAPGYRLQTAYHALFGAEYVVILLLAAFYLVSQLIGFYVYRVLRHVRGRAYPAIRLFAAPFVAQAATVLLAAPPSDYLRHVALSTAVSQISNRLLWAAVQSAVALPLVWWAVVALRRCEGLDRPSLPSSEPPPSITRKES